MKYIRLIFVLLFLLPALPLSAQWSGVVDASGGFGLTPPRSEEDFGLIHYMGKADFQLRYKNPKIQWDTNLGSTYEHKENDSYRFSFSSASGSEVFQADEIQRYNLRDTTGINLHSGIRWTPAAGRTYESWIRYKFSLDQGAGSTFKSHFNDIVKEETGKEKLYVEMPHQLDNNIQVGFRTSHQLGSARRMLKGQLSLERKHRSKKGSWLMADTEEEDLKNFRSYRITPEAVTQKVDASLQWADSIITTGPCRLLLDPGIRFSAEFTNDRNSGATYDPDTDTWRDSTRLRENFDYLALSLEPYFSAKFKWKDINAQLDYAPQLYANRLTDEIHQQSIKERRPYPVGNASVNWQIAPGHKLGFRNKISIKHPTYIQICWYERQGNYLTQIYRGKENLLPTQTYAFHLDYEFRHKRFLSTTTLSYTNRLDEIEQTFNNETIDGRDYQVFTWVNAADSRILGFSQQLGWRGKQLQATIGVSNNGTMRKSRESGAVKKTSDWRVWANASLSLPNGWSIEAEANYRSKVETFFMVFKQYCTLNAKIQKKFKRMDIYLQGRDLLDNETLTQYLSEDGTSSWIETTRQNRRIVTLGVQWRF